MSIDTDHRPERPSRDHGDLPTTTGPLDVVCLDCLGNGLIVDDDSSVSGRRDALIPCSCCGLDSRGWSDDDWALWRWRLAVQSLTWLAHPAAACLDPAGRP